MKKLMVGSLVAAMAISAFAADDIESLKQEIAALKKQVSEIKKNTGGDNLKWNVDFRTAYDIVNYETAKGTSYSNDILSTRLWLGMKYAPSNKLSFIGQLSYNKAFGANPPRYGRSAMYSGTGGVVYAGIPQRAFGFDTFDWVVNENLGDNTIKVRQAYWIYFGEAGPVPYTVSVGRRPSVNGFLGNLREDDPQASPLAHTINVEFDGASILADLEKVTSVPGMSFKLCYGRGLTNADARFSNAGMDYIDNGNTLDTIDMLGFILTPFDNGQYKVMAQVYRGFNVPGFKGKGSDDAVMIQRNGSYVMNFSPVMYTLGDMDGYTLSGMVSGLNDDPSSFLGQTTVFASVAMTKTHPMKGMSMLGSSESKTGSSIWLGVQMPAVVTSDGKFGLEFNKGSKYWRPFTYGEDSLIGSKLATRGNAYEAYYTQPLTKGLSMQIRYTLLDYKYTGSQSFFGDEGAPSEISVAQAMADFMNSRGLIENQRGMYPNPVDKASNLRMYLRYRY
ncbi:MAG: DUF3373 domain-containing protein [Campylobacterales bacterium]